MTAVPAAIFPTSFAQERMWIVERLAPGSAAYHVPVALRLRGSLDRAALAAALTHVVERHEVLRTVFDQVDGQTVQCVLPAVPVPVPLREVPDEPALQAALRAEAATGFDLRHGPLLRAALYRLAPDHHVLAVTLHHLVSDGWSMRVLLDELAAAYAAISTGSAPALPELPLQYVDYAVWQRDQLTDERRAELLGYWRTVLADVPPVLELPVDRVRPPVQSMAGAELPVALSAELSQGVRDLARRHGATPYMVLLAAYGLVLGRLCRTEDVVVGTAAAARDRQTEGLIGCFLNTVPLRLRLGGAPSFAELLVRAQQVTLGALDHRDLPFDRLVDDLAPRRDLSHNPLVQTMFLLQNAPEPALVLPGLAVEPVAVARGGAQCDLSVQLREVDGRFTGFVEYATDLFEPGTVRRWWGLLETVLAAAVAAPDTAIAELPWLTADEVGELVGPPARPHAVGDPSLGALLARAAADPDVPALVWADGEVDHGELARRTERVARALVERGAGPGTLVAVHGDRDADLVVAILGVLRAGAAYVPLNVEYPRERLARTLADARPALVLTQAHRAAELPDGHPVLLVDDLPADDPGDPGERGLPAAGPGDPAYVIYTSGSTGTPKGVVVEHRSVLNLLSWMQRRYPIGPDDVVLLKTPTSFDVSVCELFWWAAAGARLAVLPAGAERDPRALLDAVHRHGVTTVQFVPSMLVPLLDLLEASPELVARAAGLRYVLCAGEELTPALAARFTRVFAGTPRPPLLANLYGPTEATVYASAHDVGATPVPDRARLPIGTAVDGVDLLVLDDAGRVQPTGVPGELFLGGAGLATGYLGRPGLTAERFVPHPHVAGARAYRTGDLCRRTPHGAVEWLGRLDFQVKVRGFRIETGEVAAALAAHPRVADAVVLHRRDGRDPSGMLVGYVVATPGPEPTWSELRAGLRETLPEHMVPGAFVVLEEFPLSPNGKVDRAALPAPALVRPELDTGFQAPRTALEQVVAEVWATVLQLDRVGVADDFFDLGGQSLLATQVASALQEVLGAEIPLRAVFEAVTVASQAELVAGIGREQGVDVDAVADLVVQVRDLTDEQVQALLAEPEG